MTTKSDEDGEERDYDEEINKFDTIPRGQTRQRKEISGETFEKTVYKLRACINCKLILSENQFRDGCPNCNHSRGGDHLSAFTAARFSGMIAVLKPEKSWVARYNKLADRLPGCYAVSLNAERTDFYDGAP